jgi:glycosyltransferase involved in cell wall biosynthesis
MIYIVTIAYNAEKTLSRTINSVLKQSHKDFCYYLCDNASTDNGKTRSIIDNYAKQDNRIVTFYNVKNRIYTGNETLLNLPYNMGDDDLYCSLDADDEYLPTFLEEMLAFINEHNLDIAACGNDFLLADKNNKLNGQRLASENMILQGIKFSMYFPIYHEYMRTVWGKLFKGKTLRNTIVDPDAPNYPRAYGGDTIFSMQAFCDAPKVGILAKSLHRYYISSKLPTVFNPNRIECDRILHEAAMDFLDEKCGFISANNARSLYYLYYSAIMGTLAVINNSTMTEQEKKQHSDDIFSCEYTQELFALDDATLKKFGEYIFH